MDFRRHFSASSLAGNLVLALVGLALAPQSHAALSIIVGTHNLPANTAGNTVQIFVVDDGNVPAPPLTDQLQLNVELDNGNTTSVPIISGVDIVTGTLLSGAGSDSGGQDPGFNRFEVSRSITTAVSFPSSPTPALVGTITISTVGINSGTYPLELTTGAGQTAYLEDGTGNPISMAVIDGFVTVIPEPATGLYLGLAGLTLLLNRSRRR